MINLLERDPNTRIGASSWSSFTDHPFFAPLDFRLLENKRLPPVFRPSQEKSNFDAVYELEELLLEQAPLEGRARKAAKKQHQQIQQLQSPMKDGTDIRRSKKDWGRRKGKGTHDEEDKEEEILEMLNQFFEPYDYTRYPSSVHPLLSVSVSVSVPVLLLLL
jgi:serine/threonine kinase 32